MDINVNAVYGHKCAVFIENAIFLKPDIIDKNWYQIWKKHSKIALNPLEYTFCRKKCVEQWQKFFVL